MPTINQQREYEKLVNKQCRICDKHITLREINAGECEFIHTKRKTKFFIHRTCLKGEQK